METSPDGSLDRVPEKQATAHLDASTETAHEAAERGHAATDKYESLHSRRRQIQD